jgi:hypothetical protein
VSQRSTSCASTGVCGGVRLASRHSLWSRLKLSLLFQEDDRMIQMRHHNECRLSRRTRRFPPMAATSPSRSACRCIPIWYYQVHFPFVRASEPAVTGSRHSWKKALWSQFMRAIGSDYRTGINNSGPIGLYSGSILEPAEKKKP